MSPLRSFLRSRRWLAMLIVAAALCVRALVPAGFMVGADTASHTLTIQICSGGEMKALTLALPVHKNAGGEHGAKSGQNDTCAFTALSMGALGGADSLLLALALAFILQLGLLPPRPAPRRLRAQVRPPLRGPPAC